jgi:dTDP-4-dehydrorhamnose reductase
LRILLTGKNGQVGWELARTLPALGEVFATDRSTLDLANVDQIRRVVREVKPDVIVNAAAYTAVDKAEAEREVAMRINGLALGTLADEAKRLGALLVHYSTDYVFDGEKGAPYVEQDQPRPLSVYGETKLAGERAIKASGCRHVILRTSWVYSHRGHNFLLTILRLAREGKPLRVVDDQRGAPTAARDLAAVSTAMLGRKVTPEGMYHATAAGQTTWHGFASEALRLTMARVSVEAISSADYPFAAKRPRYSVLDCSLLSRSFGLPAIGDWRTRLSALIADYPDLKQPTK